MKQKEKGQSVLDKYIIKKKGTEKPATPLQASRPAMPTNSPHRPQPVNYTFESARKNPPETPQLLCSTPLRHHQVDKKVNIEKDTLFIKKTAVNTSQSDTQVFMKTFEEDLEPFSQSNVEAGRWVCPQFIFIGPFDSIHQDILVQKLERLMMGCSKRVIIDWIRSRNQGNNQYISYKNLELIEDEDFWCNQMGKILGFLLKGEKELSGKIAMLPSLKNSEQVCLTRKQIFLLIASMFLCILPNQIYTKQPSFIELMTIKQIDEKYKGNSTVRLEKLKCIVNYLKYMADNIDLHEQLVIFRRITSCNKDYLNDNNWKPLLPVQLRNDKIQSGYGKGIMIDFANSQVGGGILTNGSAQEEILFSIFPELIVIRLLCEPLQDSEAIMVRGARRFNNYEGYMNTFRFTETYEKNHKQDNSLIVAVDALDFSKGLLKRNMQYSQKFQRRQLHKMLLALRQAKEYGQQKMKVFTGRWGCGIFGADECLKFCLQWIACSECGMQMNFMIEEQKCRKELQLLVKYLGDRTTMDLLNLLEQYRHEPRLTEGGLLTYLKEFA